MTISEKLRQQVIVAADYGSEYCKTSSRLTETPPVMEHILPRALDGASVMGAILTEANLSGAEVNLLEVGGSFCWHKYRLIG
ncbi:hypothetical protein H6F96_12935 [Microcoleus sp. FACHB-53]|nr:hypothetical protein [Microcoleus sp. FACHB-53]